MSILDESGSDVRICWPKNGVDRYHVRWYLSQMADVGSLNMEPLGPDMDMARSEICRTNELSIGEPGASLFSRSTNGLRHHRGKSSKLSRTTTAPLEMFQVQFFNREGLDSGIFNSVRGRSSSSSDFRSQSSIWRMLADKSDVFEDMESISPDNLYAIAGQHKRT